MGSRSQLQRALLDAAAILSSASNIARRAAMSIDVEPAAQSRRRQGGELSDGLAREEFVRAWPSKAMANDVAGTAQTTSSASATTFKKAPSITRPPTRSWPSKALNEVGEVKTARTPTFPSRSDVPIMKATVGPFDQSVAAPSTGLRDTISDSNVSVSTRMTSDDVIASALQQHPTDQSEPPLTDHKPHNDAILRSKSVQKLEPFPKVHPRSSPIDFSSQQFSEEKPLPTTDDSSTFQSPAPSPLAGDSLSEEYDATKENRVTPLRAAKVPSSRIARLLHYGSLGAGLAWGAAGTYVRGGDANEKSAGGKQFMSDDNIRRLVNKLSTMRGAALKLGQFLSIQDSNLLPEQIEQVMLRVQNSAHYMPQWQMERVMEQEFGSAWRESFDSFDDVPFASASIGQVHAARLSRKADSPLAGERVAVKVQFPGVRESIGSDLANLRWLLAASALLPRGLFLDNTIRVMRRELDDECDYAREKDMCKRFGALLNNEKDGHFAVPQVVDELCSPRVLTCEMMKGRPLTQASRLPQTQRDAIARAILELSLKELFTFRLMQTDPNWTNFLFNERTGKIELIDFGATREYDKAFMDDWLCMLRAAISGDRGACVRWSEKVGYLTGEEKDSMREAHVDSMILLGEPFRIDAPDPYPFAGQTITERVRAQIPLMLRERLTPPPEPTYSLNRKLSGAFLLCSRLKANVSCHGLFESVTRNYELGPVTTASSLDAHGISPVRGLHTSALAPSPIRQRWGNLADRWPRNIVEAVKEAETTAKHEEFVTLSAEPMGSSMASRANDASSKGTNVDLRADPVGGQAVRPSDAAESPTTAVDSMQANTDLAKKPVFVRGIEIPAKPSPPGPEDCCMSGCARCVYDLYAEDLQDFQKDFSDARAKVMALNPPLDEAQWNEEILGPRPQGANPASAKHDRRTAEERAQDEVDAVIGQLDPSMKAFLQLERSLKRKGKHPARNEESASK